MSKSWRIIVVFVLAIVGLIFLYRAVFHTPKPAFEHGTAEQVDDSKLSLEQRLAKRIGGRSKRAEELRDKEAGQSPVKIEDKKH